MKFFDGPALVDLPGAPLSPSDVGCLLQVCKTCGRLTDYGIRKRAQLTDQCQV